ncbi:MAG: hypothetical protein FD123_3786 [Bacteroidetes bacterium]|nr:MAG: hypothetical protein FD123_3786 [Bacteroidota bacterium]
MTGQIQNRRLDTVLCLLFALAGLGFAIYAYHKPVSDFGNYFFSSREAFGDKVWSNVYDVFAFNVKYSGEGVFLNHTPVPPQSMLFYLPFRFAEDVYLSRFLFNLFGVLLFVFALHRLLRSPLLKSKTGLYLLAIPALIPFYYNIAFGQSYTYIAAALIGMLLLYEKGKWLPASLLLAVVISLKTTPLVLLLYFILKKDWRFVIGTVFICLLFLALTIPATGFETVYNYYAHIFPRISDGYVSDPYSTSFHGFIVILRKLFSPDALLNPQALSDAGSAWISIVSGLISLLTLWIAFSLVWKKWNEPAAGIFVLLLFLNLSSGYMSTYSLLLLFPFFPAVNSRKDWISVFLLALAFALPPRLFDGWPVLLAHYKFWLFLAVLFLQFRDGKAIFSIPVAGFYVLGFSGIFLLAKSMNTKDIPAISYYAPEKIREHYVFRYRLDPAGLQYTYWDNKSAQQEKHADKPLLRQDEDTMLHRLNQAQEIFLPGHWQAKQFTRVNDTVVFLSDYKRGAGLYNLFCMPVKEFEALVKNR